MKNWNWMDYIYLEINEIAFFSKKLKIIFKKINFFTTIF